MADPLWQARAVSTVRLCLQLKTIPNADLIDELKSVSRVLSANVREVAASAVADALTGDDASFWGEAVGFLFSAGVRIILPKQVPRGEIIALKTDQGEAEFSAPAATEGGRPIEKVWVDAAYDRIVCMSAVQANLTVYRAFSFCQAAGRRSDNEAQGRYLTSNLLFNQVMDLVQQEHLYINNNLLWSYYAIM